jgi:hypothetical protein
MKYRHFDFRPLQLRACLRDQYQPVLGPALLAEYEDVLGRSDLFADSELSTKERGKVFDGLLNHERPQPCLASWRAACISPNGSKDCKAVSSTPSRTA